MTTTRLITISKALRAVGYEEQTNIEYVKFFPKVFEDEDSLEHFFEMIFKYGEKRKNLE